MPRACSSSRPAISRRRWSTFAGRCTTRPRRARYHAALGRALARDSRCVREAIHSLEQAARLRPQQAAFHADLAILFQRQGLNIRARKAAEMALLLAPDDPTVLRLAEELGVSGSDAGPPEKGGGLRGMLRRKP